MRVGIDLTGLLREHVGVDTYLLGLMSGLVGLGGDVEYVAFVNREDRALWRGRLGTRAKVIAAAMRPRPTRIPFQQIGLPALARRLELDVVHSPSVFNPVIRGRSRHLLTVHDLSALSRPREHSRLRSTSIYRRTLVASARRADLLVTPSEFVRRDVLERIPGLDAAGSASSRTGSTIASPRPLPSALTMSSPGSASAAPTCCSSARSSRARACRSSSKPSPSSSAKVAPSAS